MDNTYNSSSPTNSSYACSEPRKDSISESTLKSLRQRYSDASFKGLAPLASVDSLSGFSTTSSSKRGGETCSQKSFPVIPEIHSPSCSSSGEDEELLKRRGPPYLSTPEAAGAPHAYGPSPQLPYLYSKSNPNHHILFSKYSSSPSNISSANGGYIRAPMFNSNPSMIPNDQQPSLHNSFSSSEVPLLPPPMKETIFSAAYSRNSPPEPGFLPLPPNSPTHESWYSTRKSSRESSV